MRLCEELKLRYAGFFLHSEKLRGLLEIPL